MEARLPSEARGTTRERRAALRDRRGLARAGAQRPCESRLAAADALVPERSPAAQPCRAAARADDPEAASRLAALAHREPDAHARLRCGVPVERDEHHALHAGPPGSAVRGEVQPGEPPPGAPTPQPPPVAAQC